MPFRRAFAAPFSLPLVPSFSDDWQITPQTELLVDDGNEFETLLVDDKGGIPLTVEG